MKEVLVPTQQFNVTTTRMIGIGDQNFKHLNYTIFCNVGWKIFRHSCVPDDIDKIKEALLQWSDVEHLQVNLKVH